MYPVFRVAKEIIKHRSSPPLGLFDTHVSHHLCWPWDLDVWMEMNNGRTLTLFDLGRMGHGVRAGIFPVLRREGWAMAVAGASVRFRKRVRAFQRLEMRTRIIGWDDKFVYMEQRMAHRGETTAHLLLRAAITDADGLVRSDRWLAAFDPVPAPREMPGWAQEWSRADAQRPWPPMQD